MTVSIIIPAYNCEPYVAAALRSVLSQTESDIEAILVDDGSSDNTLRIASDIAERDKRLRVISQDHSGTPSVARNAGLKVAKGEFISFLDADDLCAPTKMSKGLSVFRRHPTVDMVFSIPRYSGEICRTPLRQGYCDRHDSHSWLRIFFFRRKAIYSCVATISIIRCLRNLPL